MSNSKSYLTSRSGRLLMPSCFGWMGLVAGGLMSGLLLLGGGCASAPSRPEPAPPVTKATEPPAASAPAEQPVAPAPRPSIADRLTQAAAKAPAPFAGEGWQPMFDGHSLSGWSETQFAGRGEVQVESGLLVLNMGDPFTGINYTNEFPKMGYEIALDALRLSGSDFFCGLTVPVGESFCSLIVGGWGGGLVGISSLDGMDASENETTKYVSFEQGRWYRIRLRITQDRIEGWIDNEKLINVLTKDRKVSLRPGEIEMSKPMGIAAWQTTSALREIKVRRVDLPDGPPRKY
ncbi:MAG TPA: family 16 glycoside hydrolase [Verrucomicrobiae bacterium]